MQRTLIIFLLLIFSHFLYSQVPYINNPNWEVIFEDDFNTFNDSLWYKAHNQTHGGDSQLEEPQVYHINNSYIQNGKLVLKTTKLTTPYPCPNPSSCPYSGQLHYYLSGQVTSKIPYKYGYFEIYAKLPSSAGYWPAFWFWNAGVTNSNCWYNEIDVFEAKGCDLDSVSHNVWYKFNCQPTINIKHFFNEDNNKYACNYSTGYHWYGVEWNYKKIRWYIDKQLIKEVDNNMGNIGIHNPMYFIMNVALFPNNNACIVNTNTIFPNYMYIERAHAYRKKCDRHTVVNNITNYNTFNYAVKKSISVSTPIPALTSVHLYATDFIELKPGFEVGLGSELSLEIDKETCE